ncbi:MAG: tryptophan synthase subunit alpha [Actinomycetaceae bacterium]|nr:tryptophan synthase subunit alpha [Actinomycetaceae bacterium]
MLTSQTAIRRRVDDGASALIAYLPVGFPSLDKTIEAGRALIDAGVDVIELGQPYSDPSMDGPVIQQACVQALAQGVRTDDVFRTVEALAKAGGVVMTMSYYNLIFTRGLDRYARDLSNAGGVGVITPDLPPEEGSEWEAASRQAGLEQTYLVAPSSSEERLRLICEHTRGWVYAASTMGVTGERASVSAAARSLVERTRQAGAQLCCVGFGVSNAEQARDVASYADGVIVGSAFIRALGGSDFTAARRRLETLASELREATLS